MKTQGIIQHESLHIRQRNRERNELTRQRRTEQAGTNIHWIITKHMCRGLINETKQGQEGDQIRKHRKN